MKWGFMASKQAELGQTPLDNTNGKGFLRRIMPYLGPAFIAAIAYVDPGNFATNIQAGARFGYLLVWVIFAANLMAMVVQGLSAKLGIVTGKNLAEMSREHDPVWLRIFLWLVAEIAAMATDVAEFLGAALGINLMFGIPMMPAMVITGIATIVMLYMHQRGARTTEALITVMIGIISLCYVIQMFMVPPDWERLGFAVVQPKFSGTESLVLSVGILGATVMPHAIYLHSALVQDRIPTRTMEQKKRLFRYERLDIIIAMSIAGIINASMLVMAASAFFDAGLRDIAAIEEAHRTLKPLVGNAASQLFGLSLLVAGVASAAVGTLAGQFVMQGFLHMRIPLWVRRVVTMAPSFIIIAIGLDTTQTLIFSQVVLSMSIPFALIPLVRYTSSRKVMGEMVNSAFMKVLATAVTTLIVGLNLYLLWDFFAG